jgi:hypothetical protein
MIGEKKQKLGRPEESKNWKAGKQKRGKDKSMAGRMSDKASKSSETPHPS